jgi:hypothetical protein
MWVLDLCSGLGGASEAFANHPHWEVVRIENNELLADVPHTRLLEVQHWLDWLPGIVLEMGSNPDVIIAGPPCTQFSLAYNSPKSIAQRAGIPYEPDTDLVEDCIEIIEFYQPTYWLIENVSGSVNDLKVHLGDYKQKIGPFVLWGKFPHVSLPAEFSHSKSDNEVWSSDPLRANKRAKWPLEISQALLEAIMTQSTLARWC